MRITKCAYCDRRFDEPDQYVSHLEKMHIDMIPDDMTPHQFYYFLRTGKKNGICKICGKQTFEWNEKSNKYKVFCSQTCKDKYVKQFRERMIGKYGKTTLLNEPEHQKKMLANRSISGVYTWRNVKTKTPYTGSYEKSFLEFLDVVLEWDPEDIIAPSPHTYYYEYEGKNHFYIPDFFIPSLNLEIEIKDGGDNPNNHHKIQDVDKVKEQLKDEVMRTNKDNFNYIKIVNKENDKFLIFLQLSKEQEASGFYKPIFMP